MDETRRALIAEHCDECKKFAELIIPEHMKGDCECEWPTGYKCLGYRWSMPHSPY